MRLALCLAAVRLASATFAVSAVLFAGSASAQEKPKPNTLTPKEIADGWILLFDGETTFGWKIDGAAEVKDGTLILGKGKKTTAQFTSNFSDLCELAVAWQGKGTLTGGKLYAEFDLKIAPDATW